MQPNEIVINLPLPDGGKMLPHCRALIAQGANPDATVRVMRGETLCFEPVPLRVFAGLTVEESAGVSARFRAYRPVPADLIAKKNETKS